MTRKRINLLYVIHALNNGGAETLAIRLSERLQSDRFNPLICSLSDEGALRTVLEKKKLAYITLGKREGKDFSLPARLRKVLMEHNIDLVHTHNQGPLLYTTLASLFLKKWIVIHTEHINMGQEFSYSNKHQLYNTFLYRRTDGFISIAQHLTDNFLENYPTLQDKIVTIRNSVDVSQFQDLQGVGVSDIRQNLSLPSRTVLLGNISALRKQKDHVTLVKAMQELSRKRDDIYLVIAGEGECEGELKKLVVDLGLEERVLFLGYRDDIENLLQQFDVFILSSLYEGLPLCLLEAMAVGCPVVATDVVGTNELVENKKTGILTKPRDPEDLANAILALLQDKSQLEQLKIRAQKALQKEFDYTSMITKYQDYYIRLAEEQS